MTRGRPKKDVATLYKRTTDSGYTNYLISVPSYYIEELRLKYDEKNRVELGVEASRDSNFMSLFPIETPTYGEWVDTLIPEKIKKGRSEKNKKDIIIDNNDRKKKGPIQTSEKIKLKNKINDTEARLKWIKELRQEAKEYHAKRKQDLNDVEEIAKKELLEYKKKLEKIINGL